VANEKIDPLPFGIASENHWLHHFSRPTVVVLVQQDEVNIQVGFKVDALGHPPKMAAHFH